MVIVEKGRQRYGIVAGWASGGFRAWPGPATFAAMVLLSAWGTLRAILVLVIVWQVLRIITRMQQERQAGAPRPTPSDGRSKGQVRIERVDRTRSGRPDDGSIEDADFEEIR
jgi:hypothetical protein